MADSGFDVVLQEWIPGPATNCYLVDGFWRLSLSRQFWRSGVTSRFTSGRDSTLGERVTSLPLPSLIADPGPFRGLPLKVQETVSGKSFDMLTRIYDEVTVADMRNQGMQSESQNRVESGTNCER